MKFTGTTMEHFNELSCPKILQLHCQISAIFVMYLLIKFKQSGAFDLIYFQPAYPVYICYP